MSGVESPSQKVSRNLQKAIDDLRRDITKVEMWADALHGFSQPIAEYELAPARLLKRSPGKSGR